MANLKTLKLTNIGQLREANLAFGDLTVLVGPQATGKSISLQFLKLMVDCGQVQEQLSRHGLDWSNKLPEFFDIYFGEGMQYIWHEGKSGVSWNNKEIDVPKLVKRRQTGKTENLFLIPAQRVLAMRDGWPRYFTDYSPGDPFAVREFSEKLRMVVEDLGSSGELFPQKNRLKSEIRELLEESIFRTFRLKVDKSRLQKRMVLGAQGSPLPYMVWSAGQREFVPLLLGLYWLMPPSKVSTRDQIEWVVIEELEMGLHPQAINVVLLIVLEMMSRGYRVCLSTHSPQVLECVWAIQQLVASKAAPSTVMDLFGVKKTERITDIATRVMKKKFKVYYFSPDGVTSDISALDPDSAEFAMQDWGGLAEFSSRVNDVVAKAVANSHRSRR